MDESIGLPFPDFWAVEHIAIIFVKAIKLIISK
jgi:hypothetical protein